MTNAVKRHWPEYLMEACGLGLFMISASGFAIVLFHPAAPGAVLGPPLRRALMGLVMGLTAISLIYSPWGQQSGAHFNPAASALLALLWTGFWIYPTAALLGMLLAAEVHQRSSAPAVPCAKLHHANDRRCIFRCRYARNPS